MHARHCQPTRWDVVYYLHDDQDPDSETAVLRIEADSHYDAVEAAREALGDTLEVKEVFETGSGPSRAGWN